MSNGLWESRTNWSQLKKHLLLEPLLGGSRWAAAFGSLLLFAFVVQVVTGVLLSMNYSPSTESAWPSVNFIMREVRFGALIRSLHHWGSSGMVILLLCHLVQVFVWGAYKKPREFTWMTGVLLLMLTLGLSFTGYLLPWDQKAYWATKVGLGIASTTPVVGETIKTTLQGGPNMGNVTLTRFFAIHVFVLPGLLMTIVVVHLYFFRVHGVTPPWWESPKQLDAEKEPFWPGQAFKDAVCALAFIIALVAWSHWHPAPLEAKADPSQPYEARPEWYFMSLFYLLQFFKGPYEVVATFVLPALFFGLLFFWPWLDRNPARDPRRRPVAVGMLGLATSGLIGLTIFAIVTDTRMKEPAAVLASSPVKPSAGPLQQLDVAGLFDRHCVACHAVDGKGDKVRPGMPKIPDFTSLSWQLGHTDLHLTEGIVEGRPPQMPAYRDKLSTAEATALAIYVRAFVSPEHPEVIPNVVAPTAVAKPAPTVATTTPANATPTTEPTPSQPAPIRAAELYQTFCFACHAPDGRGGLVRAAMPTIPDFTDATWQQKIADDAVTQSILQGKGKFMVPLKDKLHAGEAEALTKYVRTFSGKTSPPAVAVTPVAPTEKPSPPSTTSPKPSVPPTVSSTDATSASTRESPLPREASEKLTLAAEQYRRFCLACHGVDGRGAAVKLAMPTIPDLSNAAWQASRNDAQLTISILDGYGKLMPPFRNHLTRSQAQALTAYMRAFGPVKKPTSPTAPADFEERMRQLQDQWRELERQINNLNR